MNQLCLNLAEGEQLYQIKFDEWVEPSRLVYLCLGRSIIETGIWEDDGLTLSFYCRRIVLIRPKYSLFVLKKASHRPWPKWTRIAAKMEDNVPVMNLQNNNDECCVTHNDREQNSLLMDGEFVGLTRLHVGS
jgi:hypothetical protein